MRPAGIPDLQQTTYHTVPLVAMDRSLRPLDQLDHQNSQSREIYSTRVFTTGQQRIDFLAFVHLYRRKMPYKQCSCSCIALNGLSD